MSKIKVGMAGHDVLFQIERGRQVVDSMTGNAEFPTPTPTLIAVTASIDAAEAAYNDAINGDKVKRAILKVARAEMYALINQLANYVANVAAGDELIILSSGFSVVAPPQSAPPMTKVDALTLLVSNNSPGLIHAMWDAVKGRKLYELQMTTTPLVADSWLTTAKPSKPFFIISGLTRGTTYYVRVRAIGKDNGTGAWSDVISEMSL